MKKLKNNTNKNLNKNILIILTALTLSACGGDGDEAPATSTEKPPVVDGGDTDEPIEEEPPVKEPPVEEEYNFATFTPFVDNESELLSTQNHNFEYYDYENLNGVMVQGVRYNNTDELMPLTQFIGQVGYHNIRDKIDEWFVGCDYLDVQFKDFVDPPYVNEPAGDVYTIFCQADENTIDMKISFVFHLNYFNADFHHDFYNVPQQINISYSESNEKGQFNLEMNEALWVPGADPNIDEEKDFHTYFVRNTMLLETNIL